MLNGTLRVWQAIVVVAMVILLAVVVGEVAADQPSARAYVATGNFEIPAHEVVTDHVACEHHTLALGGGVELFNAGTEAVKGTYPWLPEESGDGWVAVVENTSDHQEGARVYATCG
jgi:hypothetical protein